MKKKLAGLLTALLVLSCATPVLASPSTQAPQPVVNATLPDGTVVKVEQTVNDSVKAEAYTEAAKVAQSVTGATSATTTATVVAVVDIKLDKIPEGGAVLTLSVDGVKAGESIVLLHQKADGTWETIIPSAVTDGAVVATFTSLSPVAIVKLTQTTAVTTPVAPTAPKAGVSVVLPLAALVCAAGATVCKRKFD